MVFYEEGKKVRYNPYNMKKDQKKGDGQEVDVYQVKNEVVKFYKPYCKKIRMSKETCEFFLKIHTKRILLPTKILLDKKHQIRGYKMVYMENFGPDSFYSLSKISLAYEMALLYEDICTLSNNHIVIDDLDTDNTIYHNGIYFIDPGSYKKEDDIDSEIVYGMNMDRINEYLLRKILRTCCISLSKDYHKVNAVMKIIEKEMDSKNLNPLKYLLEGMEYTSILELVTSKLKELKSITMNKKKIYLEADCNLIYSDGNIEIYDYKENQEFKQLSIYKTPSLKLRPKEIERIKGITTRRILTPIDYISRAKNRDEVVTTLRKKNHRNDFNNLTGKEVSSEFDELIKDVEQLSRNHIFIGNITKDDMIYDDGIYINNVENFEVCKDEEEAIRRNRASFNNFILSLIEEELSHISSYEMKQEIITTIKERTQTYVGNTIYSELYGATSFRDCAKKLTKTRIRKEN